MRYFVTLLIFLSGNLFSQSLLITPEAKLKEVKSGFKTIFSIGFGAEVQMAIGGSATSFNTNIELAPHVGKGFYFAGGMNHHKLPENDKQRITYIYLTFNKGVDPAKNLFMYSGMGLTLGITPKNANNIIGLYAAFNMLYEITSAVGIGLNIQTYFNFDSFHVIPGLKMGLMF